MINARHKIALLNHSFNVKRLHRINSIFLKTLRISSNLFVLEIMALMPEIVKQ